MRSSLLKFRPSMGRETRTRLDGQNIFELRSGRFVDRKEPLRTSIVYRRIGVTFLGPRYQGGVATVGLKYQNGYACQAEIPQRASPSCRNTSARVSHSHRLPGRRNPLMATIPGRRYRIQRKYQGGATPLGPDTRALFAFRAQFRSGVSPLWPNTRAVLSVRAELTGWGYSLQIKYQGGVILWGRNTRAALSRL